MDPLRMHAYKIKAINKHKRQQFLDNVVLYTLTSLVCTLFCATPLWYPPLNATFNVFLFFSLPQITSLVFTPKVLFIIGNLIVIFLVGSESKIFTSKTSSYSPTDVYYNEHVARRSRSPRKCVFLEKKVNEFVSVKKASTCENESEDEGQKGYWIEKVKVVEKVKEVELDGEALPAEELNKLADDFIARVNRRRRLEAELFCRG